MRVNIAGIGVDNVDMNEAVERAAGFLREEGAHYAVTPNAEILYDALHSEELRGVLTRADLVLPDGQGVILASKLLKTPLRCKVAGVEFAAAFAKKLGELGGSLFLLGAKPGVAERAAEKLTELAPGLRIAGVKDGYFKDDREAVEAVRAAAPDAVYICLGAPRQEFFIDAHKDELGAKFMVGLGGSLDVFAGEAKRAPRLFIKLGLEWFYRLLREPTRLGRMMRLPKFLLAVLRWKRKGAAA